MIPLADLSRRCLLAVDVENYSTRNILGQTEAQRVLHDTIHQAASEAGLNPGSWVPQWSGDGMLTVLPDGVPEPVLLSGMVPRLAELLREYNQARVRQAQVRLRVAVHFGLVHLGGKTGFPGDAVVAVSRLVDSGPPRRVLEMAPAVNLALIVSTDTFEFVRHQYAGLRPELFRQVRVRVKSFAATAWVHAPETDVNLLGDLDDPADLAVAVTSPTIEAVCTNPANQGPGFFEVHGTSDGVFGCPDASIYVLVFPDRPRAEGWYLQRRPASVRSTGEWSARAQLGSEEYPAGDGHTFRLVAVVTANQPRYDGRSIDEVSPGRAVGQPGDIEPGHAQSLIVDLVLKR